MNVLCVMPWYPATAARFFAEAFSLADCRTLFCGPKYFDHYGLSYDSMELPFVDIELERRSDWYLNKIIDEAVFRHKFIPDFIFLSEETYQNEIVGTNKVPVVLWSADGWPNAFERRESLQPTLAYTQHPLGVKPAPQPHIPQGWKFLPGGFCPVQHVFFNTEERRVNFALHATMYGERQRLCDDLRAAGFSVQSGPASPKDYCIGYNHADLTYHNSNGQAEVKWRFYEAAAMGCVNICDKNILLDAMGYEPWIDYVPIWGFGSEFDGEGWPSSRMLIDVVKFMLEYADRVPNMRYHVLDRIKRSESYIHRVRAIFADLVRVGAMRGSVNDEYVDYDQVIRKYFKWEN